MEAKAGMSNLFIGWSDNAFPNAQVEPNKKLTVTKKITENQTDEARMGGKDSMGDNDTKRFDATKWDISNNYGNL